MQQRDSRCATAVRTTAVGVAATPMEWWLRNNRNVSEEEESEVAMRRRTKQQEKNEIEKKRKERGLPARDDGGRRWRVAAWATTMEA